MNNKMRYVFLILVVLSLVVTGCATNELKKVDVPLDTTPDVPVVVPEATGDAIVDVNAVQEDSEGDPHREFSHSSFTTIKSDDKYSLLRCKIFTGRTHQIRATICSLGYPVVGDKIYGLDDSFFLKFINDTLTKDEWNVLVIANQALHSYITTVPMMNGGTKIFTSSPSDNWPINL